MPQVASEAATHAFKPAMPKPARAAPSSERAYGSPFDSLIDDGTQGPASQPPQSPPASADTTAAQPDLAKPPAKIEGAKATSRRPRPPRLRKQWPPPNLPSFTAGTPKAKAVDPAIPQDDSGKPADDPKLSAKAAFDLQSNVKRNRQPATLTKSLRLHLLLDRCEFDQLLGWPDGAYTMTATATDASGQTTAISTQIQARMDSVDLTQNPPLLSINGQNYTVTQLQRIVAPGA